MPLSFRTLILSPAAVKTTKAKTDVGQNKNQNPPPKAKSKPGTPKSKSEGSQTPPSAANKASGLAQDLSMLGLEEERVRRDDSPVPAMSMKQAELIEKIQKEEASQEKKGVSLVVVGAYTLFPSHVLNFGLRATLRQATLMPESPRLWDECFTS